MQQIRSRSRPFFQAPLLVLLVTVVILASNAVLPETTHAQGFGVYEQGTCTMAMGGAAVAHPCNDGSSLFFNPAGILSTDGVTLSGGATVISTAGEFTSDYDRSQTELQSDPIPVPHLFGTIDLDSRLAVGIGAYVPYGLESVWPKDWDGAFEGYDNSVQAIYIQPTVAYQLTDRIRVGGGPIIGIAEVGLRQRVDVSAQEVPSEEVPEGTTFGNLGIPFHTAFADAALEATGALGYGGHVGAVVDVTDRLNLGARYLLPITFEYEGEARFEQIPTGLTLPANNPITGQPTPLDLILEPSFVDGPLVNQSVETEITMPAQFVIGTAFQATERLLLKADYQWTGWSSFDEITLDFERDALDQTRDEGFENTSAVRIGGAYRLTSAVTLRGGYLFNQAAAPDRTVTPLLPEASRNHFTAGLGWSITDSVELNVAYQYLSQNDRRGRIRSERPGEENPTAEELNSGLYSFTGHLFGSTLTIKL